MALELHLQLRFCEGKLLKLYTQEKDMGRTKSGHVTLSDIARACELSVSTVSIVLSDAPLAQHVAESTRRRIQVAAKRLGYHPDAYARSLRRRRTQTVGVLAYDMSDPFCLPVVKGIEEGLQEAQYFSLLVNAQTQRKLFDMYLRMILERRAEGVIVVASWVFEETNLLADIEKNKVPIVIVGRDLTERRVTSVLVDNRAGGAMLIRHLASLGHRRIAVIRGPREMFDSLPRWEGIQHAAAESDIQLDDRLVFQLPNLSDPMSSFEGGRRFVAEMLASEKWFTAVVAFDDLTALGVVRGLTDAGLKVPDDCSVVGFDDILSAGVSTPGITTIRQPLQEMGLLATERILRAISRSQERNGPGPGLHILQPELVVRTSSGPPPRRMKRQAPGKSPA